MQAGGDPAAGPGAGPLDRPPAMHARDAPALSVGLDLIYGTYRAVHIDKKTVWAIFGGGGFFSVTEERAALHSDLNHPGSATWPRVQLGFKGARHVQAIVAVAGMARSATATLAGPLTFHRRLFIAGDRVESRFSLGTVRAGVQWAPRRDPRRRADFLLEWGLQVGRSVLVLQGSASGRASRVYDGWFPYMRMQLRIRPWRGLVLQADTEFGTNFATGQGWAAGLSAGWWINEGVDARIGWRTEHQEYGYDVFFDDDRIMRTDFTGLQLVLRFGF